MGNPCARRSPWSWPGTRLASKCHASLLPLPWRERFPPQAPGNARALVLARKHRGSE